VIATAGSARARRQAAQLGDHLLEVLVVHGAGALEGRHVAAGEQLQIVQQGGHGGIEPALVLQLQHQTFAHIAGEYARWLEPLHRIQHPFYARDIAAQALSDLGQGRPQVAALVDPVDQGRGHRAVRRVEAGQGGLVFQVLAKGLGAGDALLHLAGEFKTAA
jgi:hypothetical protein